MAGVRYRWETCPGAVVYCPQVANNDDYSLFTAEYQTHFLFICFQVKKGIDKVHFLEL
jgi:hypothetical protein